MPERRMILYIHGFNSSAQSFKARVMRERLAALGRAAGFACPDLPHRPAAAIARLEDALQGCDPITTTLVGSSLGGYYATVLAERHGLRAALLNPAVRPYELLAAHLGPQQNLHTGERYAFTREHLDELAALEVEVIHPERYLLVVTTGDEVLDYRSAVERYRGCRQIVVPGGDHGFTDFARHLDTVLHFAGPHDSR
jgi:predicted esterase YcpF (UPF0227 family)